MQLTFLGSGSGSGHAMGNASAVLEYKNKTLCIDYGYLTAPTFASHYKKLPDAVFITHLHMDHAGGLEPLFYSAMIEDSAPITLYVPAPIIPRLHEMFADNPNPWANEPVNFWDKFKLIPTTRQFFWEGLRFHPFEVRHHSPSTAFGLSLPGKFLFSGDTRPIPEAINRYASYGDKIFHDAGRYANPSHSGVDDLLNEYNEDIRQRLHIYHHNKPEDMAYVEEKGLKAVRPFDTFTL